ncbi:Uma2 family endonuclease [Chondromyces crocatus]|uniref:Putative restriction endonuclease domain-containing protein n=1 Tax=Chondromyces crocatus TaxID=52 RepID=A0A0K1EPR1_CHOCO|nr:Uma2 family endonuclease [Chondromyces crocatus]AKT42632.1 uncharacterized protein CMC5_068590 [Chondromyces crocatus]
MGEPAIKRPGPVTFDDLDAVPPHMVGEIISGTLYMSPRPAPKHALASSNLGAWLVRPFQFGLDGPGGWWILDEPELHLGQDALVPDLAGWCVERMPDLPETAYFPVAPDWVCEVLSPTTAMDDRLDKLPIYAREGVKWVWFVDPIKRAMEIHRLDARNRWETASMLRGDAVVRAAPFDAIELPLSILWKRTAAAGRKG